MVLAHLAAVERRSLCIGDKGARGGEPTVILTRHLSVCLVPHGAADSSNELAVWSCVEGAALSAGYARPPSTDGRIASQWAVGGGCWARVYVHAVCETRVPSHRSSTVRPLVAATAVGLAQCCALEENACRRPFVLSVFLHRAKAS